MKKKIKGRKLLFGVLKCILIEVLKSIIIQSNNRRKADQRSEMISSNNLLTMISKIIAFIKNYKNYKLHSIVKNIKKFHNIYCI